MKLKKGKSLCFFSAKGGVGKTINLINLAGIFQQLGKKVLIIDLDLYGGSVANALNKKYDFSIYNLVDDMIYNRFESFEKYVVNATESIDVLCAPKDPRDASKIEIRYIEDIINNAVFNYDVVLVDTNHALTDFNLMALSVVDQINFITTNDPLDLKNLKSLIAIFKDYDIKNYKIVLNNSRDPFKNYFSMYDIKHILNENINYTLSPELFLKDIEKRIMDGEIISLDKKFASVMSRDYKVFVLMATDLLNVGEENGEE
ncbi:MAG: AAA family ATPase [Bacilli bacterium]|nr:AAA family ATPase [Bacilli bacterium]